MLDNKQGRYQPVDIPEVEGEHRAFIPNQLPSIANLDIKAGTKLFNLYGDARSALTRMDMLIDKLPNPEIITSSFIIKEALLSSMIEGTRTSIAEVMLFRAVAEKNHDQKQLDEIEVNNCMNAVEFCRQQLEPGQNISMALLLEAHRRLLCSGRGSNSRPGSLRDRQNYIWSERRGAISFVPPPPEQVEGLLADLLDRINKDDPGEDPFIRAALAHVQFETIHPFEDGNGRIGRILIFLILRRHGLLSSPVLYLSSYLKRHQSRYYRLLNEVRTAGAWETWLEFIMLGVVETGAAFLSTANRLEELIASDEKKIRGAFKKSTNIEVVYKELLNYGTVSIKKLSDKTRLTASTTTKCLSRLEQIELVTETTGQKRNRLYSYQKYIDILDGDGYD